MDAVGEAMVSMVVFITFLLAVSPALVPGSSFTGDVGAGTAIPTWHRGNFPQAFHGTHVKMAGMAPTHW
jgi:hypothetical protein